VELCVTSVSLRVTIKKIRTNTEKSQVDTENLLLLKDYLLNEPALFHSSEAYKRTA